MFHKFLALKFVYNFYDTNQASTLTQSALKIQTQFVFKVQSG